VGAGLLPEDLALKSDRHHRREEHCQAVVLQTRSRSQRKAALKNQRQIRNLVSCWRCEDKSNESGREEEKSCHREGISKVACRYCLSIRWLSPGSLRPWALGNFLIVRTAEGGDGGSSKTPTWTIHLRNQCFFLSSTSASYAQTCKLHKGGWVEIAMKPCCLARRSGACSKTFQGFLSDVRNGRRNIVGKGAGGDWSGLSQWRVTSPAQEKTGEKP